MGILFLQGCYTVKQAYHFSDLYLSKRPVSEVIEDEAASAETREKLKEVQGMLAFAREAGLNVEDAYGYYIETDQKPVSYLVQAAYSDKLEFKTWWFPFVGRVPYLGFFDEKERDAEASELRNDGWDVSTGTVGAFSSLGWFADPIYTSMIYRESGDLAHLFFHELTHRTFWIEDQADFNESLAEFVGYRLTVDYLTEQKLDDQLTLFLARWEDQKTFQAWLADLKEKLNQIFKDPELSREEKLVRKAEIYSQAPKTKPQFKTDEYDYFFRKPLNNAVILGIGSYTPDIEKFTRALKCARVDHLGEFLTLLNEKITDKEDPMATLDRFCA
jgi:predicted aminopeptidase